MTTPTREDVIAAGHEIVVPTQGVESVVIAVGGSGRMCTGVSSRSEAGELE